MLCYNRFAHNNIHFFEYFVNISQLRESYFGYFVTCDDAAAQNIATTPSLKGRFMKSSTHFCTGAARVLPFETVIIRTGGKIHAIYGPE